MRTKNIYKKKKRKANTRKAIHLDVQTRKMNTERMIIIHRRITRKREVIITLVCTTPLKHRGRQAGKSGHCEEGERRRVEAQRAKWVEAAIQFMGEMACHRLSMGVRGSVGVERWLIMKNFEGYRTDERRGRVSSRHAFLWA